MANTIRELEQMEKEMLIPADIAPILGCATYTVNVAAHQGMLPFPHIILGRRVKIPRGPFIEWMKTGNASSSEPREVTV